MLEVAAIFHAVSTVAMFGLIWFVQLVHYPQFMFVGADGFTAYALQHQRRTAWLVAPLMCVETITAATLMFWVPFGGPRWIAGLGLALVACNWLATAFLQVPCHRKLAAGFDAAVVRRLVRTNWVRTISWTSRVPVAVMLLPATIA